MDTTGHRNLSAVGEKLLRPALKKSNSDKDLRIGAFYFGNWLTDVSQCIDPIAYRNFSHKLAGWDKRIQELFDRMVFDAPSWLPTSMGDITKPLQTLREDLRRAEKDFVEHVRTVLEAGASGDLAKAFKDAFRYIGYFKFVVDDQGQPSEMDTNVYLKLFNQRFTQYFPHEHLDRPELNKDQYESAKANGPLNKRTKTDGGHDLYCYLRTDIKLASGLLTYLDGGKAGTKAHQSWAGATFHKTRTKFMGRDGELHDVDDKDYEWNYHLAMLGHALHAIEDFFAHSTFVEHASAKFPADYDVFQRYEEAEVLSKRLKEWDPSITDHEDNWKTLKNDTHVVTGYFDFVDTIVSLEHVAGHLLKRPNEKLGKSVDDLVKYDYEKLLTDTLELATDFKKVWNDPKNDPSTKGYSDDEGNLAVKLLREKGGEGLEMLEGKAKVNKIVGLMKDGPLNDLPPEIKDSFGDSVKLFGAYKLGKSIYQSVKTVHDFVTSPLSWLKKFLPIAVIDLLRKYGEVYLTNLFLDYIGAKRIGCHSLIAKDAGPELFNRASTECAKAVHWYVVQILTRHYRRPVVDAARSDEGAKNRNRVYLIEQLDWLELCEYFLCHPFSRVVGQATVKEVSVPIVHVTRRDPKSRMSPDSLVSLAKEYAPTFQPVPGGPQEFDWQVIADANFPTAGMTKHDRERVVNRVLREQETGLIVSDNVNYAFKPGLRIKIPYQKTKITVLEARDMSKAWWYPVIAGKDGYRSLARWFDATGSLADDAPPDAHRPFPVAKSDNDAFHEEVLSEQNGLRQFYEGSALKELY